MYDIVFVVFGHVGQNITALKIMIDGGVEDRMLSFPFLSGTLFYLNSVYSWNQNGECGIFW